MTDWIQTYTGRRFWPLEPHPDDVCVEDIAHALSMLCRYNGHCRQFYSVAEHSLLVCLAVSRRAPRHPVQQMQALLHDAAEAYLADVPSPVKPYLTGYAAAEQRVERAIATAFRLPGLDKTPLVAEMDRRVLVDEATKLMPVHVEDWRGRHGEAAGVHVLGLAPDAAERQFLRRFRALQEVLSC